MIEGPPFYVPIVFVLTTLATVAFLFSAVRSTRREGLPQRLIIFFTAFWILLTGVLAAGGFYRYLESIPPRIIAFGALPSILFFLVSALVFRKSLTDRMSLRVLTLLHVVRVPVEIVLYWLFKNGLVPEEMTLSGWNLDILSGLTAPMVYWMAFRRNGVQRALLLGWNIAAFLLLVTIVTISILGSKSPFQQFGFEQPNIAVTYFPFAWLPTIIVPIVFFAHVASFIRLFKPER